MVRNLLTHGKAHAFVHDFFLPQELSDEIYP